MQIANVKQRQILPRVGKIWACTPQNLASDGVCLCNNCSLKCKHIFGFYYKIKLIETASTGSGENRD